MHASLPGTAAARRSRLTAAVAPWWHTVLLVLLLGSVSFLNAHRTRHGGFAAHHTRLYATTIVAEWVLFLLTWWGLHLKRIPLAEVLGFRRGLRAWAEDLGVALIFWIAAVLSLALISLALRLAHFASAQKAITALAPRNGTEMLLWVALCLTAGFCEEFVFRGYFLRQFSSPIHRVWLGVLFSSLLFGVSHGYEGAAGMIVIVVYGALFCVLALARNSLRPGMFAHAWHDLATGIALVFLRHAHLH
jgi:uncharacterized protein